MGDLFYGIVCKFYLDAFSLKQSYLLLDERVLRYRKDLFKSIFVEILKFYSDRETSLQLRYEILRLRCAESSRAYEQHMICFDRSVLCIDNASFNDRKDISLDSFSRYVSSRAVCRASRYLIYFIYEYDAVLLSIFKSLFRDLIHIYKVLGFLLSQYLLSFLDLDLLVLDFFRHHVAKYVADRDTHTFVAHIEFVALRIVCDLYLYILLIELPVSELLSYLLSLEPCVSLIGSLCFFSDLFLLLLLILLLLTLIAAVVQYEIEWTVMLVASRLFAAGYDRVYDLFFRDLFSYNILLFKLGSLRYPDRRFDQISYHGVYVSSNVSYFSKFRGFDFYERRVHEFRKPSRDLCFTYTCRPHHKYIFRCDFFHHIIGEETSSVSVSQSYSYRFFCFVLSDDVFIKCLDNFFRGHVI